MPRLSHDHLCHLVFHDERGEPVEIGAVLRPAEGLERAREGARGVRQRETDPDRAHVDAQHPAGRTRRLTARRHLQVLRPAAAEIDLARLVGDRRREPAAEVELGGRVVGCARPGRDAAAPAELRAVRAAVPRRGRCPRGCTRLVRTRSSTSVAVATACSPACNAAGIPAGSVPPWATSALPPPRPRPPGRLPAADRWPTVRARARPGSVLPRVPPCHRTPTRAGPPRARRPAPATDVERERPQIAAQAGR